MDDDDEIEHIYLEDAEKEPQPVRQPGLTPAVDNEEERGKFKRILIGIFLVAAMLTFVRGVEVRRFGADFMAVFFITFAAIKFADLEGFALTYRNYDIIAKIVRPWGYVLPFFLVLMGFWYLLSDAPFRLNVFALIITSTALVGAVPAYRRHDKTQYAYHKTYLRLPFTRINLTENATMFIVAVVMLVLSTQ